MRTGALRFILQRKRPIVTGFCLCLLGGLGFVDYITGYELSFFSFYFIPVALMGWYVGRWPAMLMALLSAFIWGWVDSLAAERYSSVYLTIWNMMVRLVAFLIVGVTLAQIRKDMDRQKKLNAELSQSLVMIKQLSGLVPICSSCKRIRNDQGYWEQLEEFIHAHSEARFSHGICPECVKKLYPGLYNDEGKLASKPMQQAR